MIFLRLQMHKIKLKIEIQINKVKTITLRIIIITTIIGEDFLLMIKIITISFYYLTHKLRNRNNKMKKNRLKFK